MKSSRRAWCFLPPSSHAVHAVLCPQAVCLDVLAQMVLLVGAPCVEAEEVLELSLMLLEVSGHSLPSLCLCLRQLHELLSFSFSFSVSVSATNGLHSRSLDILPEPNACMAQSPDFLSSASESSQSRTTMHGKLSRPLPLPISVSSSASASRTAQ